MRALFIATVLAIAISSYMLVSSSFGAFLREATPHTILVASDNPPDGH